MIQHCGYCAIVGRPNVGKSTLLNRLLGQKISITSRRPQTTRHRILGIKTTADTQIMYVDTPGIHRQASKAMNRYMNRVAQGAIADVDVIVFMVDGLRWTDEDEDIFRQLATLTTPLILALNKVDRIPDKGTLLPYIQALAQRHDFAAIVPIAARTGGNVADLEKAVMKYLPQGPACFPPDQITDRSERFLAGELIREKLMRRLGQELPYALTVEIERFEVADNVAQIDAIIWVEKENHKAIVIGKGGEGLKAVGTQARLDMEKIFDHKVVLKLWVKVKEGWADDERALKSLGYHLV